MAENSKIQWTHHTFNPWRGCTKVSAGCTNCYAETLAGRNPKVLGVWGPKGTRVVASESMWREPIRWNREAKEAGERRRVFCASLADVFEGPETMPVASVPIIHAARVRLFHLISETPHLDWLLLTKRPENIRRHCGDGLPRSWAESMPTNVWLGTSVENQATADERIPELLKVPAAVRFLSCEPLLGPVNFMQVLITEKLNRGCPESWRPEAFQPGPKLDWAIVGGESGGGARPCAVEWVRFIVSQCRAAGAACFVKQLGAQPHDCSDGSDRPNAGTLLELIDRKGGEPNEWPVDLRVREFPYVRS